MDLILTKAGHTLCYKFHNQKEMPYFIAILPADSGRLPHFDRAVGLGARRRHEYQRLADMERKPGC